SSDSFISCCGSISRWGNVLFLGGHLEQSTFRCHSHNSFTGHATRFRAVGQYQTIFRRSFGSTGISSRKTRAPRWRHPPKSARLDLQPRPVRSYADASFRGGTTSKREPGGSESAQPTTAIEWRQRL